MFQLWKPCRNNPESYHLARAYEEAVRAQLSQCSAARQAHLQLSKLHHAASRTGATDRAPAAPRGSTEILLRAMPVAARPAPRLLLQHHNDR